MSLRDVRFAPIATNLLRPSKTTQSAMSRHMPRRKTEALLDDLVGEREQR
jgi:hypothetical protein